MSLRQQTAAAILAQNLERVRNSRHPIPSESEFGRQLGIGQRQYNRLRKMEHDIRISALDEISSKLDLQPWHLLMPDFEPNNPPPKLPRSHAEQQLYKSIEAAVLAVQSSTRTR